MLSHGRWLSRRQPVGQQARQLVQADRRQHVEEGLLVDTGYRIIER
jgi:hypothetical protein